MRLLEIWCEISSHISIVKLFLSTHISYQISFRCNMLFVFPMDCVIGKKSANRIVISSTSKKEINENLLIKNNKMGIFMHCFSGIYYKAVKPEQ